MRESSCDVGFRFAKLTVFFDRKTERLHFFRQKDGWGIFDRRTEGQIFFDRKTDGVFLTEEQKDRIGYLSPLTCETLLTDRAHPPPTYV